MTTAGAKIGRACKICQSNLAKEVEYMIMTGCTNQEIVDFCIEKTNRKFSIGNIYNHLKHVDPETARVLKIMRQRKEGVTSLDRYAPALDMLWQFIEKGQTKIITQGYDTNTKDFVVSWLRALDIFFKHSELEDVRVIEEYRVLASKHHSLLFAVNNFLTKEQRDYLESKMEELRDILEGEVVQNQIEGE